MTRMSKEFCLVLLGTGILTAGYFTAPSPDEEMEKKAEEQAGATGPGTARGYHGHGLLPVRPQPDVRRQLRRPPASAYPPTSRGGFGGVGRAVRRRRGLSRCAGCPATPGPNWQKRVESHGLLLPHPPRRAVLGRVGLLPVPRVRDRHARTRHLRPATRCAWSSSSTSSTSACSACSSSRQEFEELVIRSLGGRRAVRLRPVRPRLRRRRRRRRLLEYNADTPTALVEASVAQWFWLKDVDERGDQFNSIHERLIEAWQAVRERDGGPIHFAAIERRTSKTTSPSSTCATRPSRPGSKTDVPRRRARSAGTAPAGAFVDRTGADPPLLQALPVGVAGPRRVRHERPHGARRAGSSRRGR